MKPKKILSVIISAVCASLCISVPVTAYEELVPDGMQYAAKDYDEKNVKTTADGLKYVIRDDHIEIVDCEDYVSDPVIPAEIDGIPVTAIGNNAFAFRYISKFELKSITLPDSIISIGDNAFKGSYYMTTLTIPKSVQHIGVGINAGSFEFTEINVDKDNPYFTAVDGILYNKDMTTLVEFPSAKNETSFKVPDSVTEIYGEAFEACTKLEKIDLTNNVIKIGKNAFRGCSSLKAFDIPDKLKEIPDGMLWGCSSITEITIPDSVQTVGGAFCYCTDLKTIYIPDSVTSIGGNAFYECYNLKSVVLPDSIKTLGSGMFIRCFELEYLKLPADITEIPYELCAGCVGLKGIEIPKNVNTIKRSAFYGAALESITIPDSVEVIEYAAFQSCNNLAEINISESHIFKHLGDCAFGYGNEFSTTKWYESQPDGYVYIGKNFYHYKGDVSKEDFITIKEGTVTICASAFRDQKNLKNVKLPESVRYINDGAFQQCSSLNNINIPENVEIIGNDAFRLTGLTEITIPASTKSIGGTAFYECQKLQKFTIYSFDCILCAKPYAPNEMLPENVPIYGYYGSTAEEYANEYNRKFYPLVSDSGAFLPSNPESSEMTESQTTSPSTKPNPAATQPPTHAPTLPTLASSVTSTVPAATNPDKDSTDPPITDSKGKIVVPEGAQADMFGDVNTDGNIDISDAVKLNLFLLDNIKYAIYDTAIANSDCFCDGIIDSTDSLLLVNYVTMLINYNILGAS